MIYICTLLKSALKTANRKTCNISYKFDFILNFKNTFSLMTMYE